MFVSPGGPELETNALRLLIRQKLADGRLPRSAIPRVWGGKGAGEQCRACEESITKSEFVMEGPVLGDARSSDVVQFHVLCFYMWDDERLPGRTVSSSEAEPT